MQSTFHKLFIKEDLYVYHSIFNPTTLILNTSLIVLPFYRVIHKPCVPSTTTLASIVGSLRLPFRIGGFCDILYFRTIKSLYNRTPWTIALSEDSTLLRYANNSSEQDFRKLDANRR